MRYKLYAAVSGLLVAGVLATPGIAQARTVCNTTYTNTTLNGGVVVPSGDSCTLDNVTVNGSLSVSGGFIDAQNSTINGRWTINDGSSPGFLCGNSVNGGLTVQNVTSGALFSFGELNSGCAGGKVNGGITVTNNPNVTVEIDGYSVNGNLTFTNTQGGGFNELEATTVNGRGTCTNNDQPVVDDGTSAPLVNSFTGQNNGCPL